MSNFLDNLKKSLDAGQVDESVKKQFTEIVEKAEKMDNIDQLQDLTIKAMKAQDARQPLTEEERKEVEFQAMKQQQKIDEFEFTMNLSATLVNIDLAIEKLSHKITEFKASSAALRDAEISVADKKELLKKVLKEINKLETPVSEKKEQFSVTDNNFLISKDDNNNAVNESYF